MRTVLVKNFDQTEIKELVITGPDAFHLIKVVRSKINDEIQITNGQGSSFKTLVKNISKNEVVLSITSSAKQDRPHHFSLLCGKPKKATCEEIIRIAVELGLVHVLFWNSEFSQESVFSEERLEQIIKNSMEQSNNLWLPHIEFIKDLNHPLIKLSTSYIFHNHLQSDQSLMTENKLTLKQQALIVVGPEGGLSNNDLKELKNAQPKYSFVSMPSPILTTPTAIATGAGYLFAMANKNSMGG